MNFWSVSVIAKYRKLGANEKNENKPPGKENFDVKLQFSVHIVKDNICNTVTNAKFIFYFLLVIIVRSSFQK